MEKNLTDPKRSKDAPTPKDVRDRLECEFERLIIDLSFCREFLSRDYLLAENANPHDQSVLSASWIYKSCEECAFSNVARLWVDKADEITFCMVKRDFEQVIGDGPKRSARFVETWDKTYDELHSSDVKGDLAVYRDEEIGHNLIDSRMRNRIGRLRDLGQPGARGYTAKVGEVLDFCKNTAEFLFLTKCAFDSSASSFDSWQEQFTTTFKNHRRIHGALLDKLK